MAMKKTIYLNESDGYEPNSKCRREKVFGRLEFLKAFFDDPAFYMIRLRSYGVKDRELVGPGNGHWRFTTRDAAEKRFAQLCPLPEYINGEQKRLKTADARREAFLKVKVPIQPKSKPRTEGK